MNRSQYIKNFLKNLSLKPEYSVGQAFAPINIALCKYWGKRDLELNLPMTSSLSITLPEHGTQTKIEVAADHHRVVFNDEVLKEDSLVFQRIHHYLTPFSELTGLYFSVTTDNNIPHSAGLASSASGFAALVLALNDLFGWDLSHRDLSILARLGSGSACRSLWNGFVEWQKGEDPLGNDSHGFFLNDVMENLAIGLLIVSDHQKSINSRTAMKNTVETSLLYRTWPEQVERDLILLKSAIQAKDVAALGAVAESNALAMHATMLGAQPPICYFLPETLTMMHRVWQARREKGLRIFFTEDAGPNLKLIVDVRDLENIKIYFPDIKWIVF